MTRKFRKKLKSSDITPPKPSGGGVNQGFVSDIWRELAQARCRADMFRALIKLDIGVNEVEDYNASLNLKLRSNLFKSKKCQGNREVVRVAMKYKLRDANCTVSEVTRKRDKLRREIKSTYGQRTARTRKILKTFCEETDIVRKQLREDYRKKINHLRSKYEKMRNDDIPEDVAGYGEANVFNEKKFSDIKIEVIDVAVIGGDGEDDKLILAEDEKMILRLHPTFSVRDTVTIENIEYEQELGYAKVRFDLAKENEEKLEDEDTFDTVNMAPTFARNDKEKEEEIREN